MIFKINKLHLYISNRRKRKRIKRKLHAEIKQYWKQNKEKANNKSKQTKNKEYVIVLDDIKVSANVIKALKKGRKFVPYAPTPNFYMLHIVVDKICSQMRWKYRDYITTQNEKQKHNLAEGDDIKEDEKEDVNVSTGNNDSDDEITDECDDKYDTALNKMIKFGKANRDAVDSKELELFLLGIKNEILNTKYYHDYSDKYTSINTNITKDELTALNEIIADDNIIITRQDKGSGFVIMSRDTYIDKIHAAIKKHNLVMVTKDKLTECEEKIDSWLHKWSDKIGKRWKKFIEKHELEDSFAGKIYGLTKTHGKYRKLMPFRLITSIRGANMHRKD